MMEIQNQRNTSIFEQHSPSGTLSMIDYVEIKGYKSIRNAKVNIAPINVLIGANGAGKSNFISFFGFLTNLYKQNLQSFVSLNGGMDRFLFQGQSVTESILGQISFSDYRNGYSFVLQQGDGAFVVTNEGQWYDGDVRTSYPNSSEALLKTSTAYRADYIRNHLSSYLLNHFHDTGRNSPFSKESHIENDIYFLYEKGDNIAAFLYNIQNSAPKDYFQIVKTIQSIAPYFSDFYLQPNENGYVRLQWQDKFSSSVYGASNFSDGTMRFVALTALFLQPKLPNTIIIDEPELGLHPKAIEKLAGLIKSAASRGCQVIVSTQSTDLVSCFEPKDVIVVDQVDGASEFKRLSESELAPWLDEFALGDLWKRNIIAGGQP